MLCDPKMGLAVPKTLTAHTGMDALTHAIEAYVASARSDFSDPLALKAISDIYVASDTIWKDSCFASFREDSYCCLSACAAAFF